MGGALAMHVGFRLMPKVAGVFALSSFLSHTSSIYQVRKHYRFKHITVEGLYGTLKLIRGDNTVQNFHECNFLLWMMWVLQSVENMQQEGIITLPPLFMCHGDRDSLVPHEWGKNTFQALKKLGVDGEFHTILNALHEMKEKELLQLYEWINQCIPPV
jgi:phospholipase/carboxylesterase